MGWNWEPMKLDKNWEDSGLKSEVTTGRTGNVWYVIADASLRLCSPGYFMVDTSPVGRNNSFSLIWEGVNGGCWSIQTFPIVEVFTRSFTSCKTTWAGVSQANHVNSFHTVLRHNMADTQLSWSISSCLRNQRKRHTLSILCPLPSRINPVPVWLLGGPKTCSSPWTQRT